MSASASIRQLVDAAFAQHDAVQSEPVPAAPIERATPPQSTNAEIRAMKMMEAFGLTDKDLTVRARMAVEIIVECLVETTDRVAKLERMPFEYTGAHEAAKLYRKGQFATCDGSLWACMRETMQRPGDGPDWQLAVKKGRDAR